MFEVVEETLANLRRVLPGYDFDYIPRSTNSRNGRPEEEYNTAWLVSGSRKIGGISKTEDRMWISREFHNVGATSFSKSCTTNTFPNLVKREKLKVSPIRGRI